MSLKTQPFAHLDKMCNVNHDSDPNVGAQERKASIIGGAVAAAAAVISRSPASIPLGLLGAALIYRGTTGRCELYRKLGINTTEPTPAPAPAEDVAVPPAPAANEI
jgi:uncharacterized membrane protein